MAELVEHHRLESVWMPLIEANQFIRDNDRPVWEGECVGPDIRGIV